jgi:uncharacterized membrane protein
MKKYLFAGIAILTPLLITIILLIFIIDLFTDPFLDVMKGFLSSFDSSLTLLRHPNVVTLIARILILIGLFFVIVFLGFIGRIFFVKTIVNWTNKLLSKIPVVKTIYNTSKDVIKAVISSKKDRKAFLRPVSVPFPTADGYVVGFISGEVPPYCQEKVEKELIPVFVPTAPHPISGYLIMMPKEDVKEIEMTNEQAVKFTVSCGLIVPEEYKKDVSQLTKE